MRFRSADGYWSAVGRSYIVTSADSMTVRYCLNEGNVRPEPAGMMSRHYFDQAIGNGALLPAHVNVG
jgi:hypothetical protein